MRYLLGVDVGTTSMKAAVFDENAVLVASAVRDYTLAVSGDRVEFDPEGYWTMLQSIMEELTAKYPVTAMSIDTQCETMIVTDEAGVPLYPAIVWLDNRAADQADQLRAHFGEKTVYDVTGQPEITATWPAAKLLWLKQEEPEVFAGIRKVFLLEDWLLFKLTGRFVTEETLQSSTIYYDIHRHAWWQEMLDYIGVSPTVLPLVAPSGSVVGAYNGITVAAGVMDQIAGAIGAGAVEKGVISEMTGTTMAIFIPTDTVPAYNPASKVPCHLNYDGGCCLLMWSPTAGIALKWFRQQFCSDLSFRELDDLAAAVPPGSAGLTFLPYLCGSAMPHYDPDARGVLWGLTMEHGRGHVARAIMESVACMLKQDLDYVGANCSVIRTMGGAAKSPLWCQIKADVTGKTLTTLKTDETACLGSAILAGVACGVFPDVATACRKAVAVDKTYTPSGADYGECLSRYEAVDAKMWAK